MAKDRSLEGVIDCSGDVPLVQQSAKDECDINLIVERVARGADLSLLSRSSAPMYGDFTNLPDLRSALLTVNKARDMFMRLDARVRERFSNDPALLMDFLNNPSNFDEGVKLGLIIPRSKKDVDVAPDGPGAGSSAAVKAAKPPVGGV